MKKIAYVFVVSAFIALAASIYYYNGYTSTIITTYSFDVLADHKNLTKNSLVIFDIDRVLLIETDPYERGHRKERKQSENISSFLHKTSKIAHAFDLKQRLALWQIYVENLSERLIDPTIPSIIKELQDNGIKAIALTRFFTGKIGTTDHIENARIKKLAQEGINFGRSFSEYPTISFPQYIYHGHTSMFKDGVLFTAFASSKGALLSAFFEAIHWYPDQVIMFDDKKANLVSVHDALKKLSIPFTGYLYLKAKTLPSYFDKPYSEIQLKHLIRYNEWFDLQKCRKKCTS